MHGANHQQNLNKHNQVSNQHCQSSVHENHAGVNGGGILIYYGDPVIYNCEIRDNTADDNGEGIYVWAQNSSMIKVGNCLIHRNISGAYGGGFSIRNKCDVKMRNCIIWANMPSSIYVDNSAVPNLAYCDIYDGFPGAGSISDDPLFHSGIHGEYYLSNIECGQNQTSPCVNTGGQMAVDECTELNWEEICMDTLTTRTDHVIDQFRVDMGFTETPLFSKIRYTVTITGVLVASRWGNDLIRKMRRKQEINWLS
ncbi:right-handed parallel beta-helix repeat-containing protein [bacterium]|nr:right-handed parallel beta-helix repeat-containing protein [bacterium]